MAPPCSAVNAGPSPQGVVLAQGGREHGYSVHFIDQKPAFDVRVHGKVSRVVAQRPSDRMRMRLEASLTPTTMRLSVDDEVVGQAQSPGLIPVQPKDALLG